MNWPFWPIQSIRCNVRAVAKLCHFLRVFKCPITLIYKGQNSNQLIIKRFFRENFIKDIGLRVCKFGSEKFGLKKLIYSSSQLIVDGSRSR